MALRTKLSIMNSALTPLGWDVTTLNSGRPEVTAIEQNYDEIVRACFEMNQFPFGKGRETLTGRTAGSFGFTDAYPFPTYVLHISEVWLNNRRASDLEEGWEILDRTIHLNAASRTVEIEYHKGGAEHLWSAAFTRAVILHLQAILKDFSEETREAQAKREEAEFLLSKAEVKSSLNRSRTRPFRPGRLRRWHYWAGRG